MEIELKDKFIELWRKYFLDAELPIACYFSNNYSNAVKVKTPTHWRCVICDLARVRRGESLAFDIDSLSCNGAKRYFGFTDYIRDDFEYFLSCGNERVEGERYKKTPEIVLETMKNRQKLPVSGNYIIFKRWDNLRGDDKPDIIIFFAKPDVLSGLFTLANYDRIEPNGVITPFSAGCGSIVHYPYLEIKSDEPRAVIGLFDVSARPCVQNDILSFSVPLVKFKKMVDYMEESFLITDSWKKVMKRIMKYE